MPSSLGQLGESYAAAYLDQLGYRLVAANFTLPVGRNLRGAIINAEIDLHRSKDTLLRLVRTTRSQRRSTQASPDNTRGPRLSQNARHRKRIRSLRRRHRHHQQRLNPTARTTSKLLDRRIPPQAPLDHRLLLLTERAATEGRPYSCSPSRNFVECAR